MCYYYPDAAKLGGAIMAGEGSTSAPSECFWWQVGVEEWHGQVRERKPKERKAKMACSFVLPSLNYLLNIEFARYKISTNWDHKADWAKGKGGVSHSAIDYRQTFPELQASLSIQDTTTCTTTTGICGMRVSGLGLDGGSRSSSISSSGNGSKGDDLCLYPNEVIVTDGSREFAEYTTLRSWVRQWLNYLKWYYMVAVSPGVTIQDLLDAPFVNRKWQVESTDSQLVRFGLVWKVFDLVDLRLRANLAYRSFKPIVPFGLTPEGAFLWGPYIKDLIRVLIKLAKLVSVRSIKWRGVLWYPRVRYCFDENNELFSRMDMASFEKEVIPNDPRGMVGRFVSLNPATGLAPSDIRSMVRSLVICLTHASEVRGAAKVNAQLQL
ncbi:hypothetical protein Lal_00019308 [Lupinus albus]|nr:hypothetical protein Lal_00019308 [Lupinus albus]